MNRDPFSLGQTLLRFAGTVLLAALALTWAAHLLQTIWPVLVVVGGVVLGFGGLWMVLAWWRRRQSRW